MAQTTGVSPSLTVNSAQSLHRGSKSRKFAKRAGNLRPYSTSPPNPHIKRQEWPHNRSSTDTPSKSHLPGFTDSRQVDKSSISRQQKIFHPQTQSPTRSSTPKQPDRPLSYAELIERQRAQKTLQEELDRAKKDYEAQIQTSFSQPVEPDLTRTTPFRPQPGTPRFYRALHEIQFGPDDKSYPFPENSQPIGGLRETKKIYFKTAHRFLLSRFLSAKYQASLESKKEPKRLDNLAKRTAFRIIQQQEMGKQQVEFNKEELLQWKEGDETYVLPVTTDDITSEGETKITFRDFTQTQASIRLAAKALQENCVIGFPTETVYGLGANALSTSAVEKIYKAKNRPADNPLITHFGSLEQLRSFSEIPEIYLPLVEAFWPGPLTILLPVKNEMGISPLVTAGLDTLAVRIPSSPLARALLLETNLPIAAPSANASTRPSPTLAEHVRTDLNGRIPLILSADQDPNTPCDVGLESTVVDGLSDPPTILRLGGISPEEIRSLGGPWGNTVIYKKPAATKETNGVSTDEDFKPRTPGMKYRHYSPRCPVYVYPFNYPQPEKPSNRLPPSPETDRKVAVLCTRNWEPKQDSGAQVQFNWLGNESEDIARNLFKAVREMDEWGAEIILVEGIEEVGLGRSVMERLRKMAGGVIEQQNDHL